MKNLGYFKNSLLISAVALSVLSSSANAVSESTVKALLCPQGEYIDLRVLTNLHKFSDEEWRDFKSHIETLMPDRYKTWRHRIGNILGRKSSQSIQKLYDVAHDLISVDMEGGDRFNVINGLNCIPEGRLGDFSRLIQSILSDDINMRSSHRALTVLCLSEAENQDVLFVPQFEELAKNLSRNCSLPDSNDFSNDFYGLLVKMKKLSMNAIQDERVFNVFSYMARNGISLQAIGEAIRALSGVNGNDDNRNRVLNHLQSLVDQHIDAQSLHLAVGGIFRVGGLDNWEQFANLAHWLRLGGRGGKWNTSYGTFEIKGTEDLDRPFGFFNSTAQLIEMFYRSDFSPAKRQLIYTQLQSLQGLGIIGNDDALSQIVNSLVNCEDNDRAMRFVSKLKSVTGYGWEEKDLYILVQRIYAAAGERPSEYVPQPKRGLGHPPERRDDEVMS